MQILFYKQQTDYTCGPASMRMILSALKIKKSEKELAQLLKTRRKTGTKNKSFSLLAKRLNLPSIAKKNSSFQELKAYQNKNYLIILNYFHPEEKIGHYAVLKKIDKKYIYLLDPAFGKNHKYSLAEFKKIWKGKHEKTRRWFFALKR